LKAVAAAAAAVAAVVDVAAAAAAGSDRRSGDCTRPAFDHAGMKIRVSAYDRLDLTLLEECHDGQNLSGRVVLQKQGMLAEEFLCCCLRGHHHV